jgi:hypothetical protein
MSIKIGSLVRANNVSSDNYGQFAQITRFEDELYEVKWLNTGRFSQFEESQLELVETHKICDIVGGLKEGDIVITNADGSKVWDSWIIGEIASFKTKNSGRKAIYMWNNVADGSTSGKARPEQWRYSWAIMADNSVADMVIIVKAHKKRKRCHECNKLFEANELQVGAIEFDHNNKKYDEHLYCEDCWSEKFYTCTKCNEAIWQVDSCTNEDGDIFCTVCYEEEYCHCEACERELRKRDAQEGSDDCYYCDDCYSERFSSCSHCEHTFRNDDLIYIEDNDEYLCSACNAQRRGKCIHDYGYRPEPIFNKVKWEQPLYMGVELEVQREDGEVGEYAEDLMKFLKGQGVDSHFYLKHDSSIGDDGFEIVTHPFTLQFAHKNIGFQKILDWLDKNDFTSEEGGDCGLHVHISRDFFEELDITKLRLFFRANEEYIKTFSKRDGSKEDEEHDYHYCAFEKASLMDIVKDCPQEDRYWAFNCFKSSRETVEIRVFRGTLNIKRFIAILQFVDAISHFVKKIGVASLVVGEGQYKNNSWKLFLDWAREQNKYGVMLRHFKEMEICV